MGWTHEVYSYADVRDSEPFLSRARLRPEEARSIGSHPHALPTDLAGVLLVRDGATIGSIRLISGLVRIGQNDHPLSWTSTWEFVGRPEDSPGAGLMIARALEEAGSLAACGLAARSREIFRFLRFEEIVLSRWLLVVRSRPLLARRLPRVLASALSLPVDMALWSRRRLAQGSSADGLMLERIARFDERMDAIDVASRGPLWFPRDHRELNWAIDSPWSTDPSYRYQAFYLRSTAGAVGYALTRMRSIDGANVGSVLRLGALPDHATRLALVSLVVDALVAAGSDVVEICSTRAWVTDAARRVGLTHRGGIELMARFAAPAVGAMRDHGIAFTEAEADLGEGDLLFF